MEGNAMKTRQTLAAICVLGLLSGELTSGTARTRTAHPEPAQLPVRLPLYFTPNPTAPGSFSVHRRLDDPHGLRWCERAVDA
jgi:hypothetical protein